VNEIKFWTPQYGELADEVSIFAKALFDSSMALVPRFETLP